MALGPKPRSYAQRTPKKMIRLALRSALSDRAADGKVLVVDGWGWDAPRTKEAAARSGRPRHRGPGARGARRADDVAWPSFRNLPDVHVLHDGELNAYDVLVADWVVFTRRPCRPGPSPTTEPLVSPADQATEEAP